MKNEEDNVVEESNPSPSDEHVNIEDVFGSMDNVVAMQSQRTDEEEVEKKDEEIVKTDEKEDTTPEEAEADDAEVDDNSDGEPSDMDKLREELEMSKKRQEDTRKAFEKSNQANQKVIEKIANGEELTADDLKSLSQEAPDSADGMKQMVQEVNDALPIAKAVVSQMSGKTEAELDADIEAFNSLATVDQTLITELKAIPASDRAAFIIKRGGELKEVFDIVKDNGGSVTATIANAEKISTRKLNSLKEEARAEVEKEYKEKYKDYVVSSSSRVKQSGTAPTKPNPDAIDISSVSSDDVFG